LNSPGCREEAGDPERNRVAWIGALSIIRIAPWAKADREKTGRQSFVASAMRFASATSCRRARGVAGKALWQPDSLRWLHWQARNPALFAIDPGW